MACLKTFADYKTINTLVVVIKVPYVRISDEYLLIDASFVSILVLVSVFLWTF